MPEQAQNKPKVSSTEQTVNINGVVYERVPEIVKGSCAGCCARNKADLCEELNSARSIGNCSGIVFAKAVEKLSVANNEKFTVPKTFENWLPVDYHQLSAIETGKDEFLASKTKEKTLGRKDDSGKLRYSLIPPYALEQVAKCLTTGASKYAPDNWKYVDKAKQRYLDALIRHTEAYRKGETADAEGNDHLAAIAVNALFLLEFRYSPEFNKGVSE